MEEWKEYKLGELIELKNGIAFKSSEFISKGIPVIKIKNVKPNVILTDDLSYVSEESSLNKKCFWLKPSDILITMTGNRKDGGADSWVGKAALFKKEGKYLLNQRVSAIRVCDNSIVNYKYLAYLLSSWESQLYFVNHSNSSGGQANISPTVVNEYVILLPLINTQQKIANILSSLDDKIEVNRCINEQLEELAQALFNRMFFENKELDRLPLSSFANINPLRRLSKGTEARYIEMAALPTKGSFPMDWFFKPYEGGMKFTNGDTIMARITPCLENGKTAYIDFLDKEEVAFGSTEYIVISAKEGYCSALFYFLARNKEFVDYAVSHMNGSSGRQRVSATDISNFPMPNISIEDSNQFAEIAMPIMDVIRNNSLENRALTNLRDTLLPKLMSGEIDVNEVEIQRISL